MFKEPRNQFQGIDSASLCSLAGQYDNPLPPRFLAPIDSLKIPALVGQVLCIHRTVSLEWRDCRGGGWGWEVGDGGWGGEGVFTEDFAKVFF